MRLESRHQHQAPASTEPHLNRSAVHPRCRPLRLCSRRRFHGHEPRGFRLAQALLPGEELAALQPSLTTKCRYTVAALLLLRGQPTPFRPHLSLALSHASRVRHSSAQDKMRFTSRSRGSGSITSLTTTRTPSPSYGPRARRSSNASLRPRRDTRRCIRANRGSAAKVAINKALTGRCTSSSGGPSTAARLRGGNPPLKAHCLPYAAWFCPWPTAAFTMGRRSFSS